MKSIFDCSLKMIFLFLSLALITACAKPNYQSLTPINHGPVTPETKPNPTSPTPTEPTPCALFLTTEQLCVQYQWTKIQTSETMGELDLSFYKLEKPDLKVDPALKPFLKLWMAEHGHGSRPVFVEKIETGKYHVSKIFFSMPGKWQLRFQLLNDKNEVADQVTDEINF